MQIYNFKLAICVKTLLQSRLEYKKNIQSLKIIYKISENTIFNMHKIGKAIVFLYKYSKAINIFSLSIMALVFLFMYS